MMPIHNRMIDDINQEYEYTIDPSNFRYTAFAIHCFRYGHFIGNFYRYRFHENVNEIKKYINNKRNEVDKAILESYEKKLKEILNSCEEILEKARFNNDVNFPIVLEISNNYKKNKDKPGAKDIYLKISKDIIDKEIQLYIKYEKQLILYYEQIFDIKKKLMN